jgi:hypothetical protein
VKIKHENSLKLDCANSLFAPLGYLDFNVAFAIEAITLQRRLHLTCKITRNRASIAIETIHRLILGEFWVEN